MIAYKNNNTEWTEKLKVEKLQIIKLAQKW